ncbi:hypothetical protein ACIRRA_41780 [Nocardia sp. NPDC101769]|uniref:hypothetical protein n=1 Tax=Nocardia sp. NPDC101769 TaxID=3364333 RepID=UPI003808F190
MIDQVRQFVINALQRLHYDASDVTGSTRLGQDGLDLESLALAELLIEIDAHFGFAFGEDDTERIALMTIDELAAEVAAGRIESRA